MKTRLGAVCILVAAVLFATALGMADSQSPRRHQPLVTGWRFLRGNPPGAEKPAFNDRDWRLVDLPHDWSIEDLPPREKDSLFHVVTLVPGTWRFKFGDDAGWKEASLDDSSWQTVHPPEPWSRYGAVGNETRTGWYRSRFTIPATAADKNVLIELGLVHDLDDTYVDGVKVTARSFDDIYWSNARVEARVYLLRGELAKPGEHVIAVRLRGKADGGLIAPVAHASAAGPCDPGRSAGGISTGYAVGGIGWYRNRFTLPASDQGKAVRLVFDGSYYETTVWLNGTEVGRNVYGYTAFGFDLTPLLKPAGQENVLAVRVVNPGENSRWYSGSGIYRPVYLEVTSPERITLWGVDLSTPDVTADRATVKVKVELENLQAPAAGRIRLRVTGPDGKPAGSAEASVPTDGTNALVQVFVNKPVLWSPDTPVLYRADVELLAGGKPADLETVHFGIRTLAWNAQQGFLLNGKPIELKGGCVHHDHGPLGSASFPAAEERRVAKLKAGGYNAIRCSHNPPAASFLDACDRLGMLVIDEAFDMWNKPNNPEDYSRFFKEWWKRDINAMVRRDRNHPSVIMWSIGNEITERFEPLGIETAKILADHIRSIDSTRPITSAFNSVRDQADPYFAALDICGYNYNPEKYEYDHGRQPKRVMFGTESFARDSFEYWDKVVRLPYVVGDFIWTAWDYRGESGIGHTMQHPADDNAYLMPWPWHNAFCGDFDVCGFEKPQALYRQVLWGVKPIAVAVERLGPEGRLSEADRWGWRDEEPSWTWPGADGREMVVRVYGAGDEAILTLDGKEIGRKAVGKELTTEFRVPYQAGKLVARLSGKGRQEAETVLATAGKIAGLRVSAERASIPAATDGLAFITIEAVDAQAQLIPIDASEVTVDISGPGRLAAFGTGDPTDVTSVQDSGQRLWHGRALAVIRSTGQPGTISLTAKAAGLPAATCVVRVK